MLTKSQHHTLTVASEFYVPSSSSSIANYLT